MEQAGLVSSDSYTGGDVSQNMLAIARSRFPKARFVDLDIFAIAYPARHWPTVISVHVLQHLPHYEQALLELMRVTAGKLYVVSWFDRGSEDKITFSPPSSKWDGQSFHNNNYSLAKFLDFIRAKSDRPIERLRVHRFFGPTYGISVTFDRRLAGSPPEGLLSRWTSGFRNLFGSRRAKPAQ
jgi:ubiquinone/menaquinone biosynthesis C-methylase UbiE